MVKRQQETGILLLLGGFLLVVLFFVFTRLFRVFFLRVFTVRRGCLPLRFLYVYAFGSTNLRGDELVKELVKVVSLIVI